jgi:hypothetical protein
MSQIAFVLLEVGDNEVRRFLPTRPTTTWPPKLAEIEKMNWHLADVKRKVMHGETI